MQDIKAYQMNNALLGKITSMVPSPRQAAGNMFLGGQLGVGSRITTIDAATPLVFGPAVVVVTQTPTMWDAQPERQQMLKALMETHAHTITGTDFGYTTETGESNAGHDSQMIKVPTRTIRSQVNPSVGMFEINGNLVSSFFRNWQFDMNHPDTNASILAANYGGADNIPPWVMSTFSMSMVMILFDPTMIPDRIIDCALYTNMFPTETGEIGFQRVINQAEVKERTIQFTGLVQHNANTWELGFQIATQLQLHRINYNFARPGLAGVVGATEAIQESIQDYGYGEQAAGDTGQYKQFVAFQGSTDTDHISDFTGDTQMRTANAPMDMGTAVTSSYDGTTSQA